MDDRADPIAGEGEDVEAGPVADAAGEGAKVDPERQLGVGPCRHQVVLPALAQWPENVALLGRLPTLAHVADAAVFLASDHAGATTGTVLDLTCGSAVRTTAGALVGAVG